MTLPSLPVAGESWSEGAEPVRPRPAFTVTERWTVREPQGGFASASERVSVLP